MSANLSQRARLAGGQPISYLMREALARPELISLAAGFVDSATLPLEVASEAIEELLRSESAGQAAFQYGTTHGDEELRRAILDRHVAADGSPTDRYSLDQVVLTSGSNEMLHLIADTLLDPGDIVLCASPCYFVFLGTLQNFGARTLGIEADENGMMPEALETALEQLKTSGDLDRVKAVYVASYYDNPTGTTIPAPRRAEIVELAKRHSGQHTIQVIDDTAYRELGYYGDDVPSSSSFDDEGDTVIHTGSFSKSFSPGLRVGWGILPTSLVEPVHNQKGNINFGSPHFNQRIMATVLGRGLYDPHLVSLRESYRSKLEATLAALEESFDPSDGIKWITPRGGLYVWMTLPETFDTATDGALFQKSLEEGVLYVPGEYCYPAEGEPVERNTLRLSFGVQSETRIAEGVAALARAVEQVSEKAAAGKS